MIARTFTLAVLLASVSFAEAPATPKKWLVLTPLDARFRAPFLTDAVYQRYLLDPESPPPQAGFKVAAKNGRMAAWEEVTQNEKGAFAGAPGRVAYAYTAIESDSDQIVICETRMCARVYLNGDAYAGDVYGSDRNSFAVRLRKGVNQRFPLGVSRTPVPFLLHQSRRAGACRDAPPGP